MQLIRKIQEENYLGTIYYNFPFYRGETKDDLVQAHVLFVSKEFGVIFFRCIDSIKSYTSEEKNSIDTLDSHIFSKINKRDEFRIGRRELKINVTPFVFIPNLDAPMENVIDINDVHRVIKENFKQELNDEEFDVLVATVEGTAHLKIKKDRPIKKHDSLTKGKVLNILQSHEAVFDREQKKAALNIIDSPQRIRGLAGSGKTIILTMKAALFHL